MVLLHQLHTLLQRQLRNYTIYIVQQVRPAPTHLRRLVKGDRVKTTKFQTSTRNRHTTLQAAPRAGSAMSDKTSLNTLHSNFQQQGHSFQDFVVFFVLILVFGESLLSERENKIATLCRMARMAGSTRLCS